MTKLVSTRANEKAAILLAILFIICLTKPIFQLGREFDKSNPYMKFGRNSMKNDQVRVTMDLWRNKPKTLELRQ